ncbi:MAG: hypothetical protein ABI361_08300 [Nitrososphaera sp.]|jgi:hypothetical protein
MSDKRNPREEQRTTDQIADTLRDNTMRVFDETAKVQPLLAQSVSNLQLDYFQTMKNTISTYYAYKKQMAQALNLPQFPEANEQVSKQSTEMTNNAIRSIGIYQQLTVNAMDAGRENLKIYNRTVDAVTDFNTNILRAWNAWATQQQQQAQQMLRPQ